jgi:dihydropteroate synthase
MGVVNVTPDSFSDGGRYLDPDVAIEHGLALAAAGAALLDVGGESTRPDAEPVDVSEEQGRIVPVVRALAAEANVPVSVDTTKAEVAAVALDAGAEMVNDVSGGTADSRMRSMVAESGAAYVAMHSRGTPRTMKQLAHYGDPVFEVGAELRARIVAAVDAGIDPARLLGDPGIGFAKTAEQNVALLRALPDLASQAGVPLLVGTSRKSFLARLIDDEDLDARDDATLATTVWCFEQGAAVVRVHDVAASRRAVELLEVIEQAVA